MLVKLVFLCFVAACAIAAPPTDVVPLEKQQPTVIPIISQSEELEPNGTYKFSYETGNGIKREEISYDKVLPKAEGRTAASSNEGGESDESDEIHVQQGSYSYTAPDGTVITLRYIADENGFQPIGDHLPKAPTVQQVAALSAKSGRALDVADSTGSGSAPVIAAKPIDKPEESTANSALVSAKSSSLEEAKSPVQTSDTANKESQVPTEQAKAKSTENSNEALTTAVAQSEEVTTESAVTEAAGEAKEGSSDVVAKPTEEANEATSTETAKSSEQVSEASSSEDVKSTAAESNLSTTPALAEANSSEAASTPTIQPNSTEPDTTEAASVTNIAA